jgi:hypothetical protein
MQTHMSAICQPPLVHPGICAEEGICLQRNELGFTIAFDEKGEEDVEDWEDVMEEMEDIWMREPAGVLKPKPNQVRR